MIMDYGSPVAANHDMACNHWRASTFCTGFIDVNAAGTTSLGRTYSLCRYALGLDSGQRTWLARCNPVDTQYQQSGRSSKFCVCFIELQHRRTVVVDLLVGLPLCPRYHCELPFIYTIQV